ncbi:MazG nucleotide pyrophosphohydrolase domain-containing protein [Marinimicrobium alkaliphilum]|uniref:MazG nucleotide pyrophosphohydrolase domain-containing protein n=1 Tax=Marinimicrobium alkaliphilum TaxID=2202654 RepID=UPI001E445134|nr:MazG nucleotide pyrophosphohydrolase domain-containing protein [Marinimicrobium alkaliphilum]
MSGTLDDVPVTLPALSRAAKLQKRASGVGFDWPAVDGPLDKVREELTELEEAVAAGDKIHAAEELGDLLFAVVNTARHLKIDPETALRAANRKFETRFRYVEQHCQTPLKDADMEALDRLWEAAKRAD